MRRFQKSFVFGLIVLASLSCGKSRKRKGSPGPSEGEVGKSFSIAAQDHGVPRRLLLAVGFLESNLSPIAASVPYFKIEGTSEKKSLGFKFTETAFGVPRSTLGLNFDAEGDRLDNQIDAYASWLAKNLEKSTEVKLKTPPNSPSTTIVWLSAIAKLHIPNDRNVRAIWIRDIIRILNEGRIWQDSTNGEMLELTKEPTAIVDTALEPQALGLLRIDDDVSDISSARRLTLINESSSTLANTPRRIEIVHCPLSFAGCLALQDANRESAVRLGAHYLIPANDAVVARPLQILDHERRVQMTSADGTIKDMKDVVVIMLVGNSGRYVEGVRVDADPTWFTAWQLRKLGTVIKGVCRYLNRRDPSIDEKKCSSTDGAQGVSFYSQGERPTFRWGDIPDYEKSVFSAYINAAESDPAGDVLLEMPNNQSRFPAGQELNLVARFTPGTRWLRLQRAVRCSDRNLVWDTVRTDPIRDQNEWPLKISVWDAGPNGNGRQFLRILSYNEQNELMGWNIRDFYVEKFDPGFSPPSEACL